MRLTDTSRFINIQTLNSLKKNIKNVSISQAPKYINTLKEKNKRVLLDNLFRLNNWYIRLIKLDQVELCQEKVAALQDKLQNAQEQRRLIGRKLQLTNEKTVQIQEEICKVDRLEDTEKFHDLLAKQAEMLRLESSTYKEFQDSVELEKDIFMAYCNAIRASYEKQKYQSEYTKYIKGVLGILGSSFGIFGYTKIRKRDIKDIEKKVEELQRNHGINSSMSGIVKWIGSVPGYVYSPIKPYVPSFGAVISFPNNIYRYFTGKK